MWEARKFMFEICIRQLFHRFLSCQGTISEFLKAWTTSMESVSSQKLDQFLACANSIDLISPQRELPKIRPSAKQPKKLAKLVPEYATTGSFTISKSTITITFYPRINGGTPKNLFYHQTFRRMNRNIQCFKNSKFWYWKAGRQVWVVGRQRNIVDNLGNCASPMNSFVLESNWVSGIPNS